MALPFKQWGSQSRSGGLLSAIFKQVKLLNYGGAKKITVSFDPFSEPEGVNNTRESLNYLALPRVRATNTSCALKTLVACDRSEPYVHFELIDGSEVTIKTQLLAPLEVLQQVNRFITTKAPKKDESARPELKTKAQKAAGKKKR